MGISFVTGPLGAGKTHYVVGEIMVPAIRAGRRVFHNLPLVDKAWRKIIPQGRSDLLVKMDEEFIKNIQVYLGESEKQHYGALIIIDEAHDYWPYVGCPKNPDLWRWFSWSRHQGFDIVLVTQAISRVSRNFSGLWDRRWEFFNQGLRGFFKSTYSLDVYVRGDRQKQNRTLWKYSKATFALYESQNKGFKIPDPVGKKSRIPLLVAGFLVFSVFLVFSGSWRLLHRSSTNKVEAASASPLSPVPVKKIDVIPVSNVGKKEAVEVPADLKTQSPVKLALYYDGEIASDVKGTVVGFVSVGFQNYIMLRSAGKTVRYSYIGKRSGIRIGSCFGECDSERSAPVGSTFKPPESVPLARPERREVEVAGLG